jgi:L-ascorbate metabolism protein UlaG (beta-lactamase superfamily)
MAENIVWLGHSSFRIIAAGKVLYIDPWKLSGGPAADVILVSHAHFDHASANDVKRLTKTGTVVLTSADTAKELGVPAKVLKPGDSVDVGGMKVTAVPSYNPAKRFHPRANDWLGFIIEADGRRIYYAGDTDVTPEMAKLGPVDVALLPVGGKYTMDAREAAEAAGKIRPKLAIPYHFGDVVGTRNDAEEFARLAPCPVDVLEPEG